MSLASSLAISLGGLRDKGHIKLVAFFLSTPKLKMESYRTVSVTEPGHSQLLG